MYCMKDICKKGDVYYMRKNFGAKPFVYPQPVFIIASYDEDGVADAMNAAWGCIADYKKIALYLASNHKTMKNILSQKAFTVSIADVSHVVEADYVGLVSGNDVPDKLTKANLHTMKSEVVNAPIIEEFPMTLECQFISYDPDSELLIGEIVNVCADERILNEKGQIDPMKLQPIIFDPVHNDYLSIGEKVGNAFQDGLHLKKP